MADHDGKVEPISINIIPGNVAPRWDADTIELTPLNVTITEKGMASGLPMVDFVFVDPAGKRHAFTTSGRMMSAIAGVIMGINIRNHGNPDP